MIYTAMSTMVLDNIASYMFTTMSLADRQYLASKMVADRDQYGLTPEERTMVENYLIDRAEKAAERIDAGEYYTGEETEQYFTERIQQMRAAV